jgi:hypothetical protein
MQQEGEERCPGVLGWASPYIHVIWWFGRRPSELFARMEGGFCSGFFLPFSLEV